MRSKLYGLIQIVPDCEMRPIGYGAGWYDMLRCEAICAPIPLNRLLSLAWWLYVSAYIPLFVKLLPGKLRWVDREQAINDAQRAYWRGHTDGYMSLLKEIGPKRP